MWPAGTYRKVQEFSADHYSSTYPIRGVGVPTYIGSAVALEGAVMDFHIGTTVSSNSSALEVGCPPPGIEAKKVQENSETRFRTTYILSAIALERTGVDLDIRNISKHSSSLEVACPPPGIGTKI
jgi:hypothetical protein